MVFRLNHLGVYPLLTRRRVIAEVSSDMGAFVAHGDAGDTL
jgi:hypothetical protein